MNRLAGEIMPDGEEVKVDLKNIAISVKKVSSLTSSKTVHLDLKGLGSESQATIGVDLEDDAIFEGKDNLVIKAVTTSADLVAESSGVEKFLSNVFMISVE